MKKRGLQEERRSDISHRKDLVSDKITVLYDALVFANKAAAIVCTRHGAEPPVLEEIC